MGRQANMFTRIIVLTMFLSFLVCLCSSTDTITFNHALKDGDLLISNDKSYALGFFTPGNSTSGKRYVGIWFQKLPEQMAVWVANRDNPVNGTSGILFIDSTGNLVIQDSKTNVSVWNTSLSFPPPTGIKGYSVQLQETGNLVLYHDHPDRRETQWQSLDYPTNTFLPHMKVGVDKKTGRNRVLTAWKSADDPGTGEYVVRMDPKGVPQAILYKASFPVWRLGPWNGVRWSGIPEMTPNINSYNYTDNDEEVTISCSTNDPSIYTVVMVNDSGTFSKIIWQQGNDGVMRWVGMRYFPNDDCDRYGHCGAFGVCDPYTPGNIDCRCLPGFKPKSSGDWSQGCWRIETEVCHKGEGFLKLENMKIPSTQIAEVNRAIGLKECEELCLNNCSCTAYASANISDGGMGCIAWYGELIDMRELTYGGQDIYVRVSASDLDQLVKKSEEHHGKRLIVLVILPIAAVTLVLYCLITTNIREGKTAPSNITSLQLGKYMEEARYADVLTFDLNTIRAATNNFSIDNKLGEGGFGFVYKVTL
nr:G-type lectin S-receptor-like serine/threonine-protein kinase At1g11410 [Ipomoea batatas]